MCGGVVLKTDADFILAVLDDFPSGISGIASFDVSLDAFTIDLSATDPFTIVVGLDDGFATTLISVDDFGTILPTTILFPEDCTCITQPFPVDDPILHRNIADQKVNTITRAYLSE